MLVIERLSVRQLYWRAIAETIFIDTS